MAHVDFTWSRETACSNSPARSSNFLRLCARTAPLTTATCDVYCRDNCSITEPSGPAKSLKKTLLFKQVSKSLTGVEVIVFGVVELCNRCPVLF